MSTEMIKAATRAVIHAVGGIDAAASLVRVGRSQISEYQSRNSQLVIPVDIAISLDNCAQHPFLLTVMALAEGYHLTPLKVGEGDLATDIQKVSDDFHNTVATALDVLRDGRVDPHEIPAMKTVLMGLVHSAKAALHNLRPTHGTDTANVTASVTSLGAAP